MERPRRSNAAKLAEFIEDDLEMPDSQASFASGQSSPALTPDPPPAQWPTGSILNTGSSRRLEIPDSSTESGLKNDNMSLTPVPVAGTSDIRPPLRRAAASACSPMRKHVRMDMGYAPEIAEADDSDDPDELDAGSQYYAPFETQVQDELDNEPWADHPECEDVGSLTGNVTITADKYVELANAMHTDSYFPLIRAALVAEHESDSRFGKVFFEEEPEFWEDMSLNTLCSMPERAIKELICGNLKRAYDTDSGLRETLDKFQERDGESMSTADTRRLARWLLRYVSVSPAIKENATCKEAFKRIDHQFDAQWRRINSEAERAFLASNKQTRIQSRVDNVNVFCRQLIKRCEASERDEVQLKPLTYIGYAARADHRRRQHEACGKSSNWLATLAQAVCNVLWGHGRFKMHFMVVCMLSSEPQGMVAEMLLTRIAGAYYNLGGGFCIDVAGKSLESLHFRKLTHHQNVDKWNELATWVAQHTSVKNCKYECMRITSEERDRQTAEKAASNRAKMVRLMPAITKQYGKYFSWVPKIIEYANDPAMDGDVEFRNSVAEFAQGFEELWKLKDDIQALRK